MNDMGRLITYLLIIIGSLGFWMVELWVNYLEYAGHDPLDLKERYQIAYVAQSEYLIVSELLFPLLMTIGFLALLIFKLSARPVRFALGFFLMLAAEFWVWRAYFFKERMAVYYALNEAPQNIQVFLPNHHQQFMLVFMAAFAIIVFMRESAYDRTIGAEIRDRKLRESLKSWSERERQ
jgi:hypothetical protein